MAVSLHPRLEQLLLVLVVLVGFLEGLDGVHDVGVRHWLLGLGQLLVHWGWGQEITSIALDVICNHGVIPSLPIGSLKDN